MNLNKKITKFKGDGIPAYNDKINELIDATNWLAGMRTINGKAIAESDQGPVIDLSQVSSTQAGPNATATDPDGNQAGWMKVIVLNPNQSGPAAQSAWIQWIWTGPTEYQGALPWEITPNNNQAGWIVCPKASYWGSGVCPGAATGNYQPANMTSTPADTGQSPNIYTAVPRNPINPPSSGPTFYITSRDLNEGNPVTGPYLDIWGASSALSSSDPVMQITWHFTISYEGTQVFAVNGSSSFPYPASDAKFPLDPTGWVYDPSGLPGYAQGSKLWIWQYNGAPTQNQNPQVIQTLTFSYSGGLGGGITISASSLIFMSS